MSGEPPKRNSKGNGRGIPEANPWKVFWKNFQKESEEDFLNGIPGAFSKQSQVRFCRGVLKIMFMVVSENFEENF